MELGNELNYKNVKFIKNETFKKIKNIFTSKEFSEEFNYMDFKKNAYYIENYLEEDKMLYTIGCGDYTKQFNKLNNLA